MQRRFSLIAPPAAYTPLVAEPPKSNTIVKSGGLLFFTTLKKLPKFQVGKNKDLTREN
jgi:hypothetical protein